MFVFYSKPQDYFIMYNQISTYTIVLVYNVGFSGIHFRNFDELYEYLKNIVKLFK
jgi:hypothetical protein